MRTKTHIYAGLIAIILSLVLGVPSSFALTNYLHLDYGASVVGVSSKIGPWSVGSNGVADPRDDALFQHLPLHPNW